MAPKNETAPVNTVTNFSRKYVATKTIRNIALTTSRGVKKPHPYRRGIIAAQQANNDQKSTELLIPEVSFPGSVAQGDQENCLGLREILVGFSFGNVDDAGNLEETYFDDDAKEKLNLLSELCPSIVDLQSTELLVREDPFAGSVAHEDQENYLGLGEFLVGFSFGNVDDTGNLEEAYFDDDAKEKLNALSELCPSIVDLQSTELLVREDPFAGSVAQENGLGLKELLVEISFGNVDDAGNLEATYFDEHAKEQLYAFSQLCPSIMDLQEDYDDAV